MPHVTVNGAELFYEDEGTGQPVLFIHGGFGGVESTLYPKPGAINGVLPLDAYRTISFHRRNSGRSQYLTRETSLEDLAADAHGLLRTLGLHEAIVVGDSLGGMIALRFALDYPQATSGLVLMETSAFILPRLLKVKAVLLSIRLVGPRLLYRVFRKRFLQPNWSKPVGPRRSPEKTRQDLERDREFRAKLAALPDEELYRYSLGLIRTYVAFSGRDLRPEAVRLQMPVHILHGDADTIVHTHHGRDLATLIPHATYTELPGLGHGLPYYPEGRQALRDAVEALAGPRDSESVLPLSEVGEGVGG